MRIAQSLRALFAAVLSLAAIFCPVASYEHNYNDSISQARHNLKKNHKMHDWYDLYYRHENPLDDAGKLLTVRENQVLLKQEIKNRTGVDCCPSVLEMVEPEGGKNQDDQYVELYRDGNNRQRFYELSCHQDILDKPCRFMEKKLHAQSRCVQKYSYTYALVKDTGRHHHHHRQRPNYFPSISSGPNETRWTLDYIRVRSGCSCVVMPNIKKKRDKQKGRRRQMDID
ncbi:PREDICTED: uncharacterized protein LOC108567808 [Nicrophorus vespilloides]|uniref:Uncharacterized protein LOC108567808 n=1 Tax=Nicrophorus vespilloides TaxID=110193 RepID=A0ABM1NAZ0_NICVS|nr:PREDICTED: uncharacterized protein LOC108567808 [Nicrophorus vespilloides]XP_017783988.1 PREDICTED: uncharacterized protein LOC108567808 [Nicrophorus vespilloides]XP_017783989.1 PREDICTED: uncharacterized protein LOC108567808 [Nicrophorus vespilloides]XP_017783990.1 PREDICTED: uncharacterized protein LOC108567808 [Nicrophorus vespilloides]